MTMAMYKARYQLKYKIYRKLNPFIDRRPSIDDVTAIVGRGSWTV